MIYQHTYEDAEQCIKAEMKTLYPEEYERMYGPDASHLEKDATQEKLKTTIVTVAYDHDLEFLKYNLKSIKKFCKEYHGNIVLIDDHKNDCDKTKEYLESIGQKYFVDTYAKLINNGYIRQQYIKFKSDIYAPEGTDYILHIDCDSVFTSEHSPDVFFENNKPILLKDAYEEILTRIKLRGGNPEGIKKWQETTKKFTGISVKHEYMRLMPLVYPTIIHKHAREYLESFHKKDLVDIFQNENEASEYNIIGAISDIFYQNQFRFIDATKEPENYRKYILTAGSVCKQFSGRKQQPARYVDIQNSDNAISKLVN